MKFLIQNAIVVKDFINWIHFYAFLAQVIAQSAVTMKNYNVTAVMMERYYIIKFVLIVISLKDLDLNQTII